MIFPNLNNCTVAVIGLGYVGLPLAVEIAKLKNCYLTGSELRRRVIGFDINKERLSDLKRGFDRTNEISSNELKEARFLEFTDQEEILSEADVFIVTVPTPVDLSKRPDLTPLKKASSMVGKALRLRSIDQSKKSINCLPIVIYESTVYPGTTEEVCVPILENESGLGFNSQEVNSGFFCGYSPERINPGDSSHRLINITKITSGSNPEVSSWIDSFYGSIVKAGTHKASSLKVAEAAKVIENTQRDLNIALVNELSIIFRRMNIDTLDVLEAAGTKWNFLPFRPGLVGGHCIGVDPYYLTYKSEQLGYYPEVVLAGRRINDGMGEWVVQQLVFEMARKNLMIGSSEVLILGLTFKENCSDMRNTKVIDLINALKKYSIQVDIVDPWVDKLEAKEQYNIEVLKDKKDNKKYSCVIAAVAHNDFKNYSTFEWEKTLLPNGILMDLKGIIPRELNALRL